MVLLDMATFLEGGIISESAFFEKVDKFDWEQYRNQRVLVKGCGTTIIPPWAFMTVAAKLAGVAKKVRYGNEHSSVPIFTRPAEKTTDVGQ